MPAGPRGEIDALGAEGERASAFLRGLDAPDWKAPTRCPPWDVREIVIHMTTMMEKMGDAAAGPFLAAEPAKDRISWWDYDIDEDKDESLEWMRDATARFPDGPIFDRWSASLERGVAAVGSAFNGGDPVVGPGDAPILLSEYVATRVLEITIHTMDVRDAFGLAPDPSPEGTAVTHGILSRRLGADPREMGFTETDFALLSTGRRSITDDDRRRLGVSAERLPLLA
jgi:uncharacterized protein (TIGR03083 family)